MRALLCLLLALMACSVRLSAEDTVPELKVVPNDTLTFNDGDPVIGKILDSDDKWVTFQHLGKTGSVRFPRDRIQSIAQRQTAGEAVVRFGERAFREKNDLDIRKAIEWGMKNLAATEALDLAQKVMAEQPGNAEVGELALKYLPKQQTDKIQEIANNLLKVNPRLEFAYVALADIYTQQKRQADLDKLVKAWKNNLPSSAIANRLLADQAEAQADLHDANEAFRKNYENRKDMAAAIGFARTSLKLNNYADAVRGASAAIAAAAELSTEQIAEAKAILGSAKLALGDAASALPLLSEAITATLPQEIGMIARYNLGVAHWSLGDVDEARKQWTQLSSPEAALALAIVDHKAFAQDAQIRHARLRQVAQEHNACIALEQKRYKEATAALDPKANKRQQVLTHIAAVLSSNGSDSSIRAIAATAGDESLRWQAYGLLLARKYREADAVLAKLPADDGYAAVYRVYAASAQRDESRAKEQFAKVALSKNPPSDYVARLTAEFAVAADENIQEPFDGSGDGLLPSGWQRHALGTDIRIATEQGHLVLAGTQTASADPISRAWTKWPADQLHAVLATIDIGRIGTAVVGMELLDADRANGIAYAVLGDNKLGWRELEKGVWKNWQTLPIQISGTQLSLRLEYLGGRVWATPKDNFAQKTKLNDKPIAFGEFVTISLFGYSDPGVAWSYAIDELVIQRPSQKAPPRR
jgi:hypothetical protein